MWVAVAILLYNGQVYSSDAPRQFPTKEACQEWQQSEPGLKAANDVQRNFETLLNGKDYELSFTCQEKKNN